MKFYEFYEDVKGGVERYKMSRGSRSRMSKILRGDLPDITAFIKGLVKGTYKDELDGLKKRLVKAKAEGKTEDVKKIQQKMKDLEVKVRKAKKIKSLKDKLDKADSKDEKKSIKKEIVKVYKESIPS